MTIQFVQGYLVALLGLAVGAGIGIIAATAYRRAIGRWDARITLPLLLAAAGGHLALIPVVEAERQLLFGLYVAALIGVVIVAMAGRSIWRVGAVLFPAGSIAGYFFFALQVHEVDYVGLGVKLVEVGAIAAAVVPMAMRSRDYPRQQAIG